MSLNNNTSQYIPHVCKTEDFCPTLRRINLNYFNCHCHRGRLKLYMCVDVYGSGHLCLFLCVSYKEVIILNFVPLTLKKLTQCQHY